MYEVVLHKKNPRNVSFKASEVQNWMLSHIKDVLNDTRQHTQEKV